MSFKLLQYLEEVVLLLLVMYMFIIHNVVQITVESFMDLLEHVSILGHQPPVRLLADLCQVAQTGLHCLSGITIRDVSHWNCIPRNVGAYTHAE